MVSEKEKKVLLNILRLYRDRPCLWDHSIKAYGNKKLRHEAYLELLAMYRCFDDSATLPLLKKKISNMRTNYVRELKKVIYAKKNGQEYVPTLWYYYEMAFIKDKHKPRSDTDYDDADADEVADKSESETEDSGSANNETPETMETNSSVFVEVYPPEQKFSFVTTNNTATTSSPPTPSSSKAGRSEKTHKPTKRRRESRESYRDSTYDDNLRNLEEAACDSFGRSVAVQLKKMYVENALLAQSRIQSILTEIGISDHRQKAAEKLMKYAD